MRVLPNLLHHMGVSVLRVPGWEADDVIASIATDFAKSGDSSVIFSRDKVRARNSTDCMRRRPICGMVSGARTMGKQLVSGMPRTSWQRGDMADVFADV